MNDESKAPAVDAAHAPFGIDDLMALDDATLLRAVAQAHPIDTVLICSIPGGRALAERLLSLFPDAARETFSALIQAADPTEPLATAAVLSSFRSIVKRL